MVAEGRVTCQHVRITRPERPRLTVDFSPFVLVKIIILPLLPPPPFFFQRLALFKDVTVTAAPNGDVPTSISNES